MLKQSITAAQDLTLQQKRDRVSYAKAQREMSAKRVKEAKEQLV